MWEDIYQYLFVEKNYQWIFSGIGASIFLAIINIIFRRFTVNKEKRAKNWLSKSPKKISNSSKGLRISGNSDTTLPSNKIAIQIPYTKDVTRAEDIFSDVIVSLSKQTEIGKKLLYDNQNKESLEENAQFCKSNSGRRYILPFKLSLFMRNDELCNAELELTEKSKNCIVVNLVVNPLSGEPFISKKIYDEPHIIKLSSDPLLEIWPNFRNENWKLYYVLFADEENIKDRQRLRCVLHANKDDYKELTEIRLGSSPKSDGKIYVVNETPEYIGLEMQEKGTAGVIKINYYELDYFNHYFNRKYFPADHWDGRAVLDFCPSRTIIVGGFGATEKPLDYSEEKTLDIFNYRLRKRVLLREFFPYDPVFHPSGLPSVASIKTRGDVPLEYYKFDELLFKHVHVPFIKEFESFSDHYSDIDLRYNLNLNSKLKEDQLATRGFILQMLLFITSYTRRKGRNQIFLKATYPSILSHSQAEAYRVTLNEITEWLHEKTGIDYYLKDHYHNIIGEGVQIIPINEAITGYIGAESRQSKLIFGVDIRDRVTNVVIIHDKKLRGQCSLNISGNHIIEQIVNDKKIREFLLSMEDIAVADKKEYYSDLLNSPRTQELFLTLLMKNKFDSVKEFIIFHGNAKPMKRIRTLSFYLFAGIAYYIGMLINCFSEVYKVQVKFLGDGQKFHWLIADECNIKRVNPFLEEIICDCYEMISNNTLRFVDVALSDIGHRDKEVGYGALRLDGMYRRFNESKVTDYTIIGEKNFNLSTGTIEENELYDILDIPKWPLLSFDSFEMIHHFIEKINENVANELDLEKLYQQDRNNLQLKIYDSVNFKKSVARHIVCIKDDAKRKEDETNFENESIFIMGLKEALMAFPPIKNTK